MNKSIVLDFIKKQFLLILVVLAIIFYALFFKPNPPVRVNWNKVTPNKGDATLSIITPQEINGVGRTFRVDIAIDSHNNFINAVQSYIKYDPRVLQVVKTDTSKSFCKFYPENTYSEDKGIIKLQCGTPYPGFRGKNTIESIKFLTKAIKTTDLEVMNDSMILANDGKATNLIKDFPKTSVRIKAGL